MSLTFEGYPRPDGRVGVRNHCLVLPTTSALNRVAELVESEVPSTVCVTHSGMSSQALNEMHVRVVTSFASNPNVGAVLLLGLGDDADPGPRLLTEIASAGTSVELHTLYEAGGVQAMAERVIRRAAEQVQQLNSVPRVTCPVSALVLGTECGGSDAYSGLTANPALGAAADLLVAEGGTAVLAEMPELIGAEHLLAERAVDREVARRLVDGVEAWERMVMDLGEDLRGAQPSPGNQAGGLTTIEEKSLGAAYKGGTTPLVEVVGYGEQPTRRGLVVMDTPGHDVEQLTGMVAGGCQLVAFTTGRGTPTQSPIAPTLKISTNSLTAQRLHEHIDVDAGPIALGETTPRQVGRTIFEALLEVASGRPTKAEGYGQKDFALPPVTPSLR